MYGSIKCEFENKNFSLAKKLGGEGIRQNNQVYLLHYKISNIKTALFSCA